ncbi:MAG TPA: hypothetical protein VKS24_00215 [Bradyrhizobium sp.]|nr:hypothetical protein [Bradyrhizobium sp.]
MLPPLAYTPPPPKKVEKKKRRIDVGEVEDMEEATDAEATAASRSALPAGKLPPNFPAIEGAERKPHNPPGRLSESTLSVMLQAQESE